jgi:peroxiredoxin
MLKVGETAPDFPIDDKRSLHDLLKTHAVVVFFFPRAFTPG